MIEDMISNIFLTETDSRKPLRDRGYFRLHRERKIAKRMIIAEKKGIEVQHPGRLSKSSPFGKRKTGWVARRRRRLSSLGEVAA